MFNQQKLICLDHKNGPHGWNKTIYNCQYIYIYIYGHLYMVHSITITNRNINYI